MKKYVRGKKKKSFKPRILGTPEQLESGRRFTEAYQNMIGGNPRPSASAAAWAYIEARRIHYKNMGYPDPPLHPLEIQRINSEKAAERKRIEDEKRAREEEARRLAEQKQKRVYRRRKKSSEEASSRETRSQQRSRKERVVRRVYKRKKK